MFGDTHENFLMVGWRVGAKRHTQSISCEEQETSEAPGHAAYRHAQGNAYKE